MPETDLKSAAPSRERLTVAKLLRFLSLPFSPGSLRTWLAVERFEDIPIDRLLENGIRGVLLDVDGTLCSHHAREFSEPVIGHVGKMVESGLKVAFYTNAMEDRFQIFSGVEIVTGVPAKPDRRGFETAMKHFLRLDDPARVCMVGDNYITDGGAILAGMRFIHVRPLPGRENFIHAAARSLACLCARIYFPETFDKPGG